MALAWLPVAAMQEVHKVPPERPSAVRYCPDPASGFYLPCRDISRGFREA